MGRRPGGWIPAGCPLEEEQEEAQANGSAGNSGREELGGPPAAWSPGLYTTSKQLYLQRQSVL